MDLACFQTGTPTLLSSFFEVQCSHNLTWTMTI